MNMLRIDSMEITLRIDDFEGPMDLLLHLIKEKKMDLLNLKIEVIIDEYLKFIEEMERLNLDIASSYLVMASELIEMKSKSNAGKVNYNEEQIKKILYYSKSMKRTIEKNSNIRFIIGGDGPLLEDIINKTKENEMTNNVLFLGNVTDTKSFYAMCDITINCSIKEGLALTAYESLSMNVPIISADVGGHRN